MSRAATTGIDVVLRMRDRASRGVQVALRRVNRAVEATRRVVFSLGGALAGLGVALTAKSFLDTAATFERLSLQLETVTGSADAARLSMDWIRKFAQTTPYELEQVTAAFVRLKAYGIDPMPGTLRTLGDTAAAMGKPLISAVEALADAVQGENERLKGFGITARVAGDQVAYTWSDALGRTRTTIARNTPEIIRETLLGIWNEKYAGGMQKLSGSWLGLWSNMKDVVTNWKQSVMASGPFQALKEGLAEVLDTLKRFERDGSLQRWAKAAGLAIIDAMQVVVESIDKVRKAMNVTFGAVGVLVKNWTDFRRDQLSAGYQKLVDQRLAADKAGRPYPAGAQMADLDRISAEYDRLDDQSHLIDSWLQDQADAYVRWGGIFESARALLRAIRARGAALPAGAPPAAAAPAAPQRTTPFDASGLYDNREFSGAMQHMAGIDALQQPGADATMPGGQVNDFIESARAQAEGYVDVWRTAQDERLDAAVRADGMIAASSQRLAEQWTSATQSMAAGFGQAFSQAVVYGKSFSDAMSNIVDSLVAHMLAEFAKVTALSAIGSLFGFGTFGGLFSRGLGGIFHEGGVVPRAHSGMNLLRPDEVPIIAQSGERILSRRQNRDLTAFLARAQRGEGPAPEQTTPPRPLLVRLELDGRRLAEAVVDLAAQGVAVSGRDTLVLARV